MLQKINKKNVGITAIFFVSAFLIFWPILIGGKVIANKWIFFDQYPRFSFLKQSLFNQASTLWSDSLMNGFPAHIGGWGENINFFFLSYLSFIDYTAALHWLTFFNFFLGALAMYLLARNLSLSRIASIVTASVYGFNQLSLATGNFIFFSNLLPIIPLLFLSIIKVRQSRLYFLLATFLIIAGWFGGFPELFMYTLILATVFAIFFDFEHKKDLINKFKTTKYYIFAFLLGTLAALPRLLPGYNFVDYTVRKSGAIGASFLKLGDIIEITYPYFGLRYTDFIPFVNLGSSTNIYIGILPLFFLIVFFLGIRKITKENPISKYFVVVFVFSFLMIIEYLSPYNLLSKLPVLRWFRGSTKLLPLGFFSASILAGLGLDYISVVKEKIVFKRFMASLKYVIAAILLIATAINLAFLLFRSQILNFINEYFNKNVYRQATTQRPIEHYRALINDLFGDLSKVFSFTNYHFALSIVFIVLSYLVLNLYYKNKINLDFFKKTTVVLVLLNFVVLWQGFYPLLTEKFLNHIPKTVQFLHSQEKPDSPFRVFRFWGGLSKYADLGLNAKNIQDEYSLEMEMLTPNTPLFYGISLIDGHENIMSRRQSRISSFIGSDKAPGDISWITDKNLPLPAKLSRFQSPANLKLLSMMNVKYLLTSFKLDLPLRKVFETEVTDAKIPVYIYENPNVLPRVYLADKVKFIGSDEEKAFDELINNTDFKKTTLIECLKPECLYAEHRKSFADKVSIEEIKSGYLRLRSENKHPGWLVYSESNLPTWEARINGRLTSIYTANYLYQAIYVPPGNNEIEFRYPGVLRQAVYGTEGVVKRYLK